MAVPKKKTSSSKRDMRRSQHDKMATPAVSSCRECGSPCAPHTACRECGTYRGRQVLEIDEEAAETSAE